MASCLLRLEAQYLVNTPLGVTANGALVNSSVGAHATDSGCSGTSPQSTAGIIAGSVVGVALCLGLLTALYVWRRRSGAQGACRGADNKLVDKIGICLKAVVCGLDPHDGSHKATTHTSSGCDGAGTQPALQSAYAADAQSNMQSAAAATTPAAAPTGGDGFKQEVSQCLKMSKVALQHVLVSMSKCFQILCGILGLPSCMAMHVVHQHCWPAMPAYACMQRSDACHISPFLAA